MSDDIDQVSATETPDHGPKLSYEELQAELARTRKEAASRRVSSKEKDAEIQEFQNWKESQKSELEKLADRAAAAERLVSDMKLEKLKIEIAKKADLDLDLADRIRGESEDEMLKDAKQLAERAGKRQNADLDPYAGPRGGPVRGTDDKSSLADQFRNWMENQ